MTPDRLAFDLQRTLDELQQERERTQKLLGEVDRQNRELDRLRGAMHRESNSRLLAEEALDESRDRLQLAVDAAGLALWDWQLPATQVFMTARWGELLGDIATDGYWDVAALRARLHPDDTASLREEITALLEGRSQRAVVQHRVRAGREWRWVEVHGMVAEHDSKGKPLRLMGTLADIGERKRIEQEAERARVLSDQASRAKSEFLANISHEVRTPLNALMGLTRMLMDSPLNADQSNWVSLMDQSAHGLLDLLNNILDLSRIEAGKLDIENLRFDLHQALEQAIVPFAEQASEKPLDFRFDLSPTLPQWVMGDVSRLRQVLNNLLSNAIKFTPRGGRIEVRAIALEPAGEQPSRLQLQVRDSGVGIAPEHHANVFEAFTQADASTARPYGGSGLGLAICVRLARLMGGNIELQSAHQQGSTFTLTLPLREVQAEQNPLSASAELLEMAQASSRYVGLVVLLAEDHPVNELMMRQLLLRLGCIVRVARGGVHAVAQWEQGGIDLVLMDVQMPGMSGLQATQEIRDIEARRKLPRTPIVAVTANAMPGDREACLAAGMDGYTAKPVSPQALIKEMERVLQSGEADAPQADAHLPEAPRAAVPVDMPAPAARDAAHPDALDLEKLLRRLDGDEDTLSELAHAMRADLASRQIQLQQALASRDTAAAIAHAHGLKGSLGSMTAERGARLAKGLELAARSGDWQLFARALPLLQAEARQIDMTLAQLLASGGRDLFDTRL
jgi:signal transduction histidine kinase/DNA-binding NarL/FixJ family response regulator